MKKSDIEKQLKKQLNAAAPSDFDDVRRRCGLPEKQTEKESVVVPEFAAAAAGAPRAGGGKYAKGGNKLFRAAACLTAAVLLFSCALFALLWGLSRGKGVLPLSEGYFLFDINPSVEISYDKKGRVKEAKGLNDDGAVLLYGTDLAGRSYEDAAEILFDRCVKLGYFSAARENNAVLVSASLSAGGKDEKMTEEMKRLLASEFSVRKIRGVVITGVENPALSEAAAQYGIDAQKYALILAYLAMGGKISEAEYASVAVKDLYAYLADKEKELKEKEIEDLKKETDEMEEEIFETLSEAIGDLIEQLKDYIEDFNESADEEDEERKDRYEKRLDELEDYSEEIEDAENKGECQKLVNSILTTLRGMSKEETDASLKALLNDACAQIEGLYACLEEALNELNRLKATAEEKHSERLEKFGESGGGDEDFDFEAWQEEKEKEFASSWYEFRKQWNEEREHDLDD